jgi:AAA+ ATPase superfamily predicted ATPase
VTKEEVIRLIQNSLQDFLNNHKEITEKLKELLRNVKGVNIAEFGIELEHRPERELDLRGLIDKINEWAEKNEQTVVLAIDEAQEFRKSQHFNMGGIIASLYDNCKNIVVILTGSEVGLLHEFIGKDNPKADLYGRSYEEIKVEPLTKGKSVEFLTNGFAQYGLGIEKIPIGQDAIQVAAEKLGGILGWLIKFGIKCIQRKQITVDFLSEIENEGSKLAKLEFDNFLSTREAGERYAIIMKAVAAAPTTWKAIKTNVEVETKKKIYSKNISDLLSTLEKSGFIEKIGKEYSIVDPLLKRAFTK